MDIQNLLEFINFTHDIRKVKRSMWVRDEESYENDSEHSFQIAMAALYIIEQNNLDLDVQKAMSLAIIHDVLEVHSGDTPVFGPEEGAIATQHEREAAAIVTLKSEWPKLTRMHKLIEEYEAKITNEAKFIYALDKLVPVLNNYLDNGRNWKRSNIKLDQLISVKAGKVDIDPTVKKYYDQIIEILEKNPGLFNKQS